MTATTGIQLDVRNLVKEFTDPVGKTLRVIDDVSLSVRQGEFVVVVGPSGCGKTTLLRIIQGLDQPTSGDLIHHSDDGGGDDTRFGYVFQKASLLPWRTVEGNVRFGLELAAGRHVFAGSQAASQRVQELLAMTGLEEFAGYQPHQISGGMQQRTNLARALAINPTVLLMDEPFSALDAQTRERLQREVDSVVGQFSTTVIFITHDIREAVYLADRVVVMSARPGRISHVIDVVEPRPRTVAYQQSAELAEHAREIWKLMHAEEAEDLESA